MDPGNDPSGDTRARVEALLRDPAVPVAEIARRTGVSRTRIQLWNRRAALRPPQARRRTLAAWPPERRAATLRLLAAETDPADVTEALGFARGSAPALLAALGVKRGAARDERRRPMEDAPPPLRLRALLRAHIGRQITAFDAALADPRAGMDSAKVLRDLGGLKRLLDDLGVGGKSDDDGTGEGGSRDARVHPPRETPLDIDGLRAEIARRYERFVGGGAAD